MKTFIQLTLNKEEHKVVMGVIDDLGISHGITAKTVILYSFADLKSLELGLEEEKGEAARSVLAALQETP